MSEINQLPISAWLPTTMKEAKKRGWDELDVIIVTGDAYVDHPAFGNAVIGRILESYGLKVAIISQPNWRDDLRDFKKFGKPRLFFGVTSGNMDSMVNKYTAGKRLRSSDAYTPGGDVNFRPDYATTVYTRILKELFPDSPVVIGGIEASLRRVTHYDFWQDKLLPNILTQSGADLLIYGMGEQPLRELTQQLMSGKSINDLRSIPQTAYLSDQKEKLSEEKNWKNFELTSHEVCLKDLGLKFHRTKVGDRYIIEHMRANHGILGGEPSGHIIFSKHSTTGDGSLAALKAIEAMKHFKKTLKDLVGEIELFPQVLKNVVVSKKPDLEKVPSIQKAIKDAEEKMGGKGRVLLRYSGTEPLLRVMVEGQNAELVEKLCQELSDLVKKELE